VNTDPRRGVLLPPPGLAETGSARSSTIPTIV
jgi:hypothetical protein